MKFPGLVTSICLLNVAQGFLPPSRPAVTLSHSVPHVPSLTTYQQQEQFQRKSLPVLSASIPMETPRMEKFKKNASRFCNLFPIWTLITAIIALKKPSTFLSVPSSTFPAQIGLLMLSMGINLKPSDFQRVAQRPGAVALAFVGCYGVMPALAVLVGKGLALSPSLAAGLVLVSCINGAQA